MKRIDTSALLTAIKHSLMALVVITVLAACSCAGATALRDTSWEMESLAGNDVLPGTTITLEFSGDQISGSAGCNHYGGSYRAGENSLKVSGVFWTEMACLEPEGILEQEQAYLAALSAAARYKIDGGRLEILDERGTQTLVFVALGSRVAALATPTTGQPTTAPPTPTAGITVEAASATIEATPAPTTGPPAGFQQYQDSVVGVSVYIPESWVMTSVFPGESAILQSYPEDKYVGGEPFEPGDTKCDLTIRPPDVDMASHMQQLKTEPTVTIVSEQEIVLQSGQPGTRIEVESMGRSLSLITEINERVVVLTCLGELAPFDEIAVTLLASE